MLTVKYNICDSMEIYVTAAIIHISEIPYMPMSKCVNWQLSVRTI